MDSRPIFCFSDKSYKDFEVESGVASGDVAGGSGSSGSSDSNPDNQITPSMQGSEALVPGNANHLLLVSLLEHVCSLYIHNPLAKRKLFKLLCKQLADMNIMSPLSSLDELGGIKLQYKKSFSKLFNTCITHLNLHSKMALPSPHDEPIQIFANERLPSWRLPRVGLSDVMNFHTSRYRDEFEEISQLGKGAYGSVYKVRHRLDGRLYAVKKVIFQDNTPELWCKTLREVKHLADLNHPSIIRYYTAWLEYYVPLLTDITGSYQARHHDDFYLPALTYHTQEKSKLSATSDYSNGSSIVFEESTQHKYSRQLSHGMSHDWSHDWSHDVYSLPHAAVSRSEGAILQHCHVALHIQMELCDLTLQDWLQDRNARLTDSIDVYHVVEEQMNLYIIQEILLGVHHLHSHNLIHRDIKPSNIFLNQNQLTGKLTVKIGDFGLVRRNHHSNHSNHHSHTSNHGNPGTTQGSGDDVPSSPLTPAPGHLDEPVLDISSLFLTSGVGTTIYASPEQLAGVQYGPMSDMYSIGMLMYEMYQPFCTAMERSQTLTQLRHGHVPPGFTQHWHTQSTVISHLLHDNPGERLSAKQVMNGPLFVVRSPTVESLTEEVQEKDKLLHERDKELSLCKNQIELLHCQLEEKDLELELLRKQLSSQTAT